MHERPNEKELLKHISKDEYKEYRKIDKRLWKLSKELDLLIRDHSLLSQDIELKCRNGDNYYELQSKQLLLHREIRDKDNEQNKLLTELCNFIEKMRLKYDVNNEFMNVYVKKEGK